MSDGQRDRRRTSGPACGELDCPLVQIGTDYIFGAVRPNPRPWTEQDSPSPQGVYARTKLEGERAAAVHPKHLIVRTCGLYARPSDPRATNFVKTMLRLGGDCPNFRVSENGTVPFAPKRDCPDFRLSENGTVPFEPRRCASLPISIARRPMSPT